MSANLIIAMGMSKLEDFQRPEEPLEKTRKTDTEARISKKSEMKRKLKRNQKHIRHPSVRHPAKFSNIIDKS